MDGQMNEWTDTQMDMRQFRAEFMGPWSRTGAPIDHLVTKKMELCLDTQITDVDVPKN